MDKIIITKRQVCIETSEGQKVCMSLGHFMDLLKHHYQDDIDGFPRPDGFRFVFHRGPISVLVLEHPTGLYTLKWIADDSPAPFGRRAKYRTVTISLPYIVVLAVFERDQLSNVNECFFRVAPITDPAKDTELLYPGLLNCSRYMPPDGRPLSWICTQFLDRGPIEHQQQPLKRMRVGLEALRECLFETGFNRSSEHHEYSSWYTESRSVDERISSIDRWEKATGKDATFALEVPWLKTGKSVAEVVDRIFDNYGVRDDDISSAADLARLILNHYSP